MKICIIGSGIVGSAVGRGFVNLNHEVLFFDIDKNKIKTITADGFKATNNIKLLKDYDVLFVCVPTQTKNKKIYLTVIKSVIRDIANLFRNKREYFLVVIKSTIVPTTTEKIITPLFEKYSGKRAGKDFGVCYNPEFLREKYAFEDFMNPDRIVVGEYDKKSGDILESLYAKFTCPKIRTDLKTAEMAKYANNTFYATKISFFNEIHLICQRLGIDSNVIRKIVQMDRFYSTHPWKHGEAFGGKCLPKDLEAFISFCIDNKIHDPILLKSVRNVNKIIKRGSQE